MQPISKRLVWPVAIAGLIANTACLENEKQFRDWARNEAALEFRQMVTVDAEARAAAAFERTIRALSDRARSTVMATLPAVQALEAPLGKTVTEVLDNYLRHIDTLSTSDSALEQIERELLATEELCSRLGPDFVPPPVDAAAVAGAMGNRNIDFYVAVTAGGGSGAQIDGRSMIEQWFGDLKHGVEWLLASDDEKRALDEAKRIIQEKMPSAMERATIARDSCLRVKSTSEVGSALVSLKEFLGAARVRLNSALTRAAKAMNKVYEENKRQGVLTSEFESEAMRRSLLIASERLEQRGLAMTILRGLESDTYRARMRIAVSDFQSASIHIKAARQADVWLNAFDTAIIQELGPRLVHARQKLAAVIDWCAKETRCER